MNALTEIQREAETERAQKREAELNNQLKNLKKENERLLACYYCKPALDYLLSVLNICEIENFSTRFQTELFNSLTANYGEKDYLRTLCERLTRAYGRNISTENFPAMDFEAITGIKLS